MTNDISNSDDIIDSRDVIARIEELEEQLTPRYVAGWNMPGYMPDNEPAEFDNKEDAKEYIIETLKRFEDEAQEGGEAETYCHGAEDINLAGDTFSQQIGNYVFWVTQDGTMGLDEDEQAELAALKALAEEAEGYAADWAHGETLIRDSYFKEYAQELAEDIGAINRNATWPNNCIDWDQAARELQMDYTSVEFDGVTYWIR